MKGYVTRVVRSPHAKVGQMYMVNEALLIPPDNGEPKPGICVVVWDDDDVYEQAQRLIGEYIEIE